MGEDGKEVKKCSKLPPLLASMGTAGFAYIASQAGALCYLAGREILNLATAQPLSQIPEILKEYALITSSAAAIGEVSGYAIGRKLWRALRGG